MKQLLQAKKNHKVGALVLCFLFFLLSFSSLNSYLHSQADSVYSQTESAAQVQLPDEEFGQFDIRSFFFEKNQGQFDQDVQYKLSSGQFDLFFTNDEAVFVFDQSEKSNSVIDDDDDPPKKKISFRQSFVDQLEATIVGEDLQSGVSNYLYGPNSEEWVTSVSHYGQLRYENLYLGVDLVYKRVEGALKYEFIVDPGANPNLIEVRYQSSSTNNAINPVELEVDSGDLIVRTPEGNLTERNLYAFQEINGEQIQVAAEFKLLSSDTYGFKLGSYNKSYPLVIDPFIDTSTFLGGRALIKP